MGVDVVRDTKSKLAQVFANRNVHFVDTNMILIASPIFAVILGWLLAISNTIYPISMSSR